MNKHLNLGEEVNGKLEYLIAHYEFEQSHVNKTFFIVFRATNFT